MIENGAGLNGSWLATVVLRTNGKYSNAQRLRDLKTILRQTAARNSGNGVILFPGGWFSAKEAKASKLYPWVESSLMRLLGKNSNQIVVCLGVDGRLSNMIAKDQIAMALSKSGIEALARKFHEAPSEKGKVDCAKDHLSKEERRFRYFELDGRKFFLCACYDSFGIKHKGISNFGMDVILDLVHRFNKPRTPGSGAAYFAKLGLAGASRHWDCPAFGAVVFWNCDPKNWPSGVRWNQGNKDLKKWQYSDNPLQPATKFRLEIEEGSAFVSVYRLDP